MSIKRWLRLAALSLIAMAVPVVSNAADDKSGTTKKVADGVYAFTFNHYTSMFVVGDEGVIVVESVTTANSKAMLKSIRAITTKPIRYMLHSHNHWDHSGGGKVWKDAGATIIAHAKAVAWMKANPNPRIGLVVPDEGWSGTRKDISVGNKTVELYYFGTNHGLGMTVFRLPKEKVVYIADLVSPNRLLFTIVPDFNIGETQRTLMEIEKLDFDTAIFAHAKPIGTKADVAAIRQFTNDLKSAIFAEFKKGTPSGKIPTTIRLPKYEHWAMYDQWLAMNAWRVLLDSWMGPFPWDPTAKSYVVPAGAAK